MKKTVNIPAEIESMRFHSQCAKRAARPEGFTRYMPLPYWKAYMIRRSS